MTEYIISLLNKRYSVLLRSADDVIEEATPERGIAISPDPISFYDVVATDIGRDKIRDWELFLLLPFFFRSVLGCPLCQISICLDDLPLGIELFDTPHGFTGATIDKCKLLCTSEYIDPGLARHTLYTVLTDRVYRIIRVKEAASVRADLLSGVRILKGLPSADLAIAVSTDGIVLSPPIEPSPGAICAAGLVLSNGATAFSLTSFGVEYKVEFCGALARVLTPASLLRVNKI